MRRRSEGARAVFNFTVAYPNLNRHFPPVREVKQAIHPIPHYHYAVATAETRLSLGVALYIPHNVPQLNTPSDFKVLPQTAQ